MILSVNCWVILDKSMYVKPPLQKKTQDKVYDTKATGAW
jgi:hypothetical protein